MIPGDQGEWGISTTWKQDGREPRRSAEEIIPPIRLRPKRQQRLPQPPMPLRKMQVEDFIWFAFGADESDEIFFLFSCPRTPSPYVGQHERKILKGCLLQRRPRRRADTAAFQK